tara:strand:+ start:1291 stop:1527 length:237 start_codon:yes stop_codon:yes gene_type:complete
MSDQRYFIEIEKINRVVTAIHVVEYNRILEETGKFQSSNTERDIVEISSSNALRLPPFPEVIGTYKMDADNKLVKVLD